MRPISVYSDGWLTGTGGQPQAVYSDGWLGLVQIPIDAPSDGHGNGGGGMGRSKRRRHEDDSHMRRLMREDEEIMAILWGFINVHQ